MTTALQQQEQQLAEEEKQLLQYEQEAKAVKSERTKERRFGSGVTKQSQAQQIKRKQQASEFLSKSRTARRQIATARRNISESQARTAAFERARRLAEDYVYGSSGRPQIQARNLRRGQRDAYEYYLQYVEYLKNKKRGNEPVYIVNPKYNFTPAYYTPEDYYIPAPEIKKPNISQDGAGYSTYDYTIYKGLAGKPNFLVVSGKEVYYQPPKQKTNDILPRTRGEAIVKSLSEQDLRGRSVLYKVGVGAATQGVSSLTSTGLFIKQLAKSPIKTTTSTIVGLPSAIKRGVTEGIPNLITGFKTKPFFTAGRVAGEGLFLKGTGEAISLATKSIRLTKTRLSPNYIPLENNKLIIKNVELPSKDFGKVTNIDVVNKLPRLPIEQQIKLAGTTRPVAVSGARDLFGTFKQQVAINKPLNTKKPIDKSTTALLNRFDAGKTLTSVELARLDIGLRKAGTKGLLERAFFADPTGKLRPSRLGVVNEKSATFKDLLSGNVRFKKGKPQGIIFEDVKVTKLPKAQEKTIRKLNQNTKVSAKEYGDLLKFQLKEGEFKPVGFVTQEAEIIARGKLVKTGTAGVTIIKGERVELIKARLLPATAEDIKLLRSGDVKQISKATGFKKSEVSSYLNQKPYLSPYKTSSKGLSYVARTSSPVKYGSTSKISSPVNYKSVYRGSSPAKSPTRTSSPVKYGSPTQRYTTGRSAYSPPSIVKTPAAPPKIFKANFNQRRRKGEEEDFGYRTFVYRAGKLVGLKGIRSRAESIRFGEKFVLGTARATFKVQKTKVKVRQTNINYKPNLNIFRNYRIVSGKKVAVKNTFIQRRGKRIVTRGETRDIRRRVR